MSKVKVLQEVKVIADVSRGIGYYNRDMESYARQAEALAREFNEFVRDHRSMDWVSLSVEREYENQCSHCHSIWEEKPECCQAAIDEWESAENKAETL
jgi:hypothetical protein